MEKDRSVNSGKWGVMVDERKETRKESHVSIQKIIAGGVNVLVALSLRSIDCM